MKSKDLLVIGGIGLAVYMLMPKGKAAGGSETTITMPTGGLDLGALANLFSAIPSQVIPEINIPEFKFPDIDIPEFPDWEKFFPDWEKFFPDWEKIIPALPDELKLPDIIPNLIPDIPILIPDWSNLIPDLFGGNGDKKVSQWDIWKHEQGLSISDIAEGWRKVTTLPSRFVPTEYYQRSAEVWEEKGLPETITPDWYYEQKRLTTGLLPQDIAALREDTEVKAVEKQPEYPEFPLPYYMN